MENDFWMRLGVSAALVLGNAFFVTAEYALVSARKSRIESLAKRGNRNAKLVLAALQQLSVFVAAIQVGITVFSIGVGSVTEPWITEMLGQWIGGVPAALRSGISIFVVTYFMVVLGELVPKYVTLQRPERLAMMVIGPMWLFAKVFRPIVKLIEASGALAVRPFGIRVSDSASSSIPREEMLLLIKAGSVEGAMDKVHAEMVAKAMQIDRLSARDIMVHRLDIKWLDADLSRDETLSEMKRVAHTRIPICRGDIDDIVGVVYINDIFKRWDEPKFRLEALARPAIIVPESLTIDRIVTLMREEKTQILIVADEYGGTSGMITLEDVVEEIFGELEDSLEGERPPIEIQQGGRISAKADVRFDELVHHLGLELEPHPSTDTLANVMIQELQRLPKLGDVVATPLGTLRIENMARRRVTRVSLQLSQEVAARVAQ